MTQIAELQHRITAALDQIAQGVERLDAKASEARSAPTVPAVDPEELVRVKEALDEEKLANAQLEERVRKLHESHRAELDAVRAAAVPAAPTVDVSAVETELRRLLQANEMLRNTNAELRGALSENVGEPHLINKAMLAELEGLRAARAVESAEMKAILTSLEPLLEAAAQEQG